MGDATIWGDSVGITWAGANDTIRESYAMVRLYWFFRMVATGGPDGSDLDGLVYDEAREAAEWLGPILAKRAGVDGV